MFYCTRVLARHIGELGDLQLSSRTPQIMGYFTFINNKPLFSMTGFPIVLHSPTLKVDCTIFKWDSLVQELLWSFVQHLAFKSSLTERTSPCVTKEYKKLVFFFGLCSATPSQMFCVFVTESNTLQNKIWIILLVSI